MFEKKIRLDVNPNGFITSLKLEIPSDGAISADLEQKAKNVNTSINLYYKSLTNPDKIPMRAASFQALTSALTKLQDVELSEHDEKWVLDNETKISRVMNFSIEKEKDRGGDVNLALDLKKTFENRPRKGVAVSSNSTNARMRPSDKEVTQSYKDTTEQSPSCCKCCC